MCGVTGPLLLVILMAACAPTASGATSIQVTLHDDGIELDVRQVSSGGIALEIHNEGELVHEVEVFSGATEGQILPVRSSVAVTTGLTLVDEVEGILVESDASLVVDLSPGTYLVICNLPGHYQNGMWAYVTVEDTIG
jgi:uncharacterized cupredoxin-like copper-binding protein